MEIFFKIYCRKQALLLESEYVINTTNEKQLSQGQKSFSLKDENGDHHDYCPGASLLWYELFRKREYNICIYIIYTYM